MRRSPLVTALLVLYPIVIAVLIGFALSAGPDKPRVAFLNEVPPDTPLQIGGEDFDLLGAKSELCERIECVPVSSEAEAREKVESGDVLGALILPADLIDRLQSLAGLNPESPTVKVLVNEEDPIKAGLVDDRINSLLSAANLKISQEVSDVSTQYLQILLDGGDFSFLGDGVSILGLKNSEQILRQVKSQLPADSPDLEELDRVIEFSHVAAENLGAAGDLLTSVTQPIAGRQGGDQRRYAEPRHVRDRRRRDDHADVRDRPAGGRIAGPRAGGERLRPADPRARLEVRPARPRRSCSGWSSRSS